MHNSCILTSSEAVTFAWIKKYLHSMKNQLKIDLYFLKIDYEINFVMETDIKKMYWTNIKTYGGVNILPGLWNKHQL